MPEEYKNIVNISIDKKALSREMIRSMSDEELDEFLTDISYQNYMHYLKGFIEGGIAAMGMNSTDEEE